MFPHGHPRFYALTMEEMDLHNRKNHDYAKGGNPLGNFDRVTQILSLYPGLKITEPRVLALVYALKQVDAVLWGWSHGVQHVVEGSHGRLQDISVYAKLADVMDEEHVKNAPTEVLRGRMLTELAESFEKEYCHADGTEVHEQHQEPDPAEAPAPDPEGQGEAALHGWTYPLSPAQEALLDIEFAEQCKREAEERLEAAYNLHPCAVEGTT
ncbi:MAG: hypothetical protein CV089_02275 [Nitrospira sp. WS110]|nr:hypothetical protein [Nitrospira sp. WS110]